MELIYFLAGIIFVECIIPLMEGLLTIILSFFEAKKTKYNEIIMNSNINLEKMQSSGESTLKQKIGFAIQDFSERLTEEDDDNDDE